MCSNLDVLIPQHQKKDYITTTSMKIMQVKIELKDVYMRLVQIAKRPSYTEQDLHQAPNQVFFLICNV